MLPSSHVVLIDDERISQYQEPIVDEDIDCRVVELADNTRKIPNDKHGSDVGVNIKTVTLTLFIEIKGLLHPNEKHQDT